MLLTKPELRIWQAMARTERQAWLAGARWAMLFTPRPAMDGIRTDLLDTLDKLEEEVGDGE